MGVKKAEKFGEFEEKRLLGCLDSAVSMVSKGASPDEALAKSAKEAGLHPDSIPLMVQAYNVGRQTYHREKCAGQGTSCLMSEHPIARVEDVEKRLYPEASSILRSRKSAAHSGVSNEYTSPPVKGRVYQEEMVKLASAPLPQPAIEHKKSDPALTGFQMAEAKRAADKAIYDLQLKLISSRDDLERKLASVKDWCRKNSALVPETEWNSVQLFGEGVREIFDFASIGLTGLKRAEKRAYITRQAVDPAKAPYSLIKAALDKAVEYIQDEATVKVACDKIERGVSKCTPFGEKNKPKEKSAVLAGSATASSLPSKVAFLGTTPGDILGPQLANYSKPKEPSDITKGMLDEINSPGHDAEMRSIHSQAMLSDLMSNDEIISGHEPHDVINAFNEVSQLTPHMSNNYAVMRSALRKYLTAGEIQPFEAHQLRELDETYGPQKQQIPNRI